MSAPVPSFQEEFDFIAALVAVKFEAYEAARDVPTGDTWV
jgi:hypothetical protein